MSLSSLTMAPQPAQPSKLISDIESGLASTSLVETTASTSSSRTVLCLDSLAWLDTLPPEGFGEGSSVFTSLPDISELGELFQTYMVKEYKQWFTDTLVKVMGKLAAGAHLIVLQSDGRRMDSDGELVEWIDKSHLAAAAADRAGLTMVWHKMVLTSSQTMSKRSTGRPSFSHLVCFVKNGCRGLCKQPAQTHGHSGTSSSEHRLSATQALAMPCGCPPVSHRPSSFAIPDIFPRGEMLWVRGIGLDCCYAGAAFLRDIGHAKRVIDPFAGVGTVLAMANALGMDALGVEISGKRCRKARNLVITDEHLQRISPLIRRITLEPSADRHVAHEQRAGIGRRAEEEEDDDEGNDH